MRPAREAVRAGRARVKRELLAETNGSYITSELLIFCTCQPSAFSPAQAETPNPCHVERNSEESEAILTAESKHPYHDLNLATPSKIYRCISARIRGKEVVLTSPRSPAHPRR
ncbi:hypothetical protein SBA1_420003 [Candidatus Sulfotelmatobacter kueseliae]|uniref:Uncharacterized protein n=1 Tax=Candidatus Sulfotelmatobacter kueseliae TaxID=2042962 RepID=A0A2U3KQX5_9BACT|nr:hypothetical protein SBA1_420003 [Candidatus Sulfotelmatobacter kueseliae]